MKSYISVLGTASGPSRHFLRVATACGTPEQDVAVAIALERSTFFPSRELFMKTELSQHCSRTAAPFTALKSTVSGAMNKSVLPGYSHLRCLTHKCQSPRCSAFLRKTVAAAMLSVSALDVRGLVLTPCRRFSSSTSIRLEPHTSQQGPIGESESSSSATHGSIGGSPSSQEKPGATAMERAAEARREIFELWSQVGEWESAYLEALQKEPLAVRKEKAVAAEAEEGERRYRALTHLLDRYDMRLTTPLEEDVCRGLGDAFDRLLLMCVPIPCGLPPAGARSDQKESNTARDEDGQEEDVVDKLGRDGSTVIGSERQSSPTQLLERVLQLASRQGRRLTVRVVQHLFARTRRYTEALAVFHALRRTHFAMSMETYHAMLYSLQRLEEEGWAERFREELIENSLRADDAVTNGGQGAVSTCRGVSEQAMEFILRGVQHPLLPENKPWLGRIMYGNGAGGEEEDINERGERFSTAAAATKQTTKSWDALGQLWVQRYKQSDSATPPSPSA